MLVSLEGVLLSTFVLIKQNRMSQRADHCSYLDLQINLLAEKEITKVLQLQRLVCRQLGIADGDIDREVVEMSKVTAVDRLAREVSQKNSGGYLNVTTAEKSPAGLRLRNFRHQGSLAHPAVAFGHRGFRLLQAAGSLRRLGNPVSIDCGARDGRSGAPADPGGVSHCPTEL